MRLPAHTQAEVERILSGVARRPRKSLPNVLTFCGGFWREPPDIRPFDGELAEDICKRCLRYCGFYVVNPAKP